MDPKNSFVRAATYSFPSTRYKNVAPQFKVGDLVRLKTGQAPQRVINVLWSDSTWRYEIKCEYLNSRKELIFRPETDFEIYTQIQQTEEIFEMKDKLFKTIKDNRFGIGLAVDSDGKYVLKMQDSGNFEAFAEVDLKRVMPYTFDVEFVTGASARNNRYSYRGREGQVEVNDLLILEDSFSIARVVAVNTESESATKTFVGRKLVTETLK